MHIEVEESGIAESAVAADEAARAVATIQLQAVAAAVALAMPGSRTAGEAAHATSALAEAAQVLGADLTEHAGALRAAVGCYAGTEDHLLAECRCAVGSP